MRNKIRFTVVFDSPAWESMSDDERAEWIGEANHALADIAQVVSVEECE